MSKTYRICRILRMLARKKRTYTTAILLAGGMGSRMQSDGVTKQLMPICGIPMLVHTARAFAACPYIDDIVIVARREEMQTVKDLMVMYRVGKCRCVVPGGETRQLSAIAGFEAIDGEKTQFVAIHDAARCLITAGQIADVVAAAYAERAAAAACRVFDTVKRANGAGFVKETVNRDELWLAQTPQVFAAELYRAAAYTAMQAKYTVTDDMMLCERIGQAVKLIDCGSNNFKVTTAEDMLRAEAVLRNREVGRL